MNERVCIIADDFTGAADAAIQFRKTGASVFLALKPWETGSANGSHDVFVVDTDSRFFGAEESYAAVLKAAEACRARGIRKFFKKIDSTIRGNVAEEIDALLRAGGYACALVAPAAPRNGRTVVGGRCLVKGVPLGSSTTGKDPFNPALTSAVPELFERRFPGKVARLDLEAVRKGPEAFRSRFLELKASGARIVVSDAESIEDLRAASSVWDEKDVLFAGASGLAEAVNPAAAPTAEAKGGLVPEGSVLFLVGSVTDTSREQAERLLEYSETRAVRLLIPSMLRDEAGELSRLAAEVARLPRDLPVLVKTYDSPEDIRRDLAFAQALGCPEKELGERVAAFIGTLVRALLEKRPFEAFFVTGGNTAAGLAEALKIPGIELLDEVLPGIPLGRFATPYRKDPLYIVSKSGGFGSRTALVDILNYLAKKKPGGCGCKESPEEGEHK